jgi:hypothetical protein
VLLECGVRHEMHEATAEVNPVIVRPLPLDKFVLPGNRMDVELFGGKSFSRNIPCSTFYTLSMIHRTNT